jgi:gamma-polyglutamate biosynthesis protein CapA
MIMKSDSHSIKIKAVGDICPGDKYIMGLGVLHTTRMYGPDFPFDASRSLLQHGDIVIGNLEGVLSNTINFSSGHTFCGTSIFADGLTRANFNVINVANNHTQEHGSEIFRETVEILTRTGIKVCGLRGTSGKYYSEPVILFVNGKTIGILGYNWIGVDYFPDADRYIAQSHDSITNYSWDRVNLTPIESSIANQHVINDIMTLRKEVDLLILIPHWGYEFVTVPPYRVTQEARSFIDAGADIILGTHPHVLQGWERYRGGLICYSLGNFIFDSHNRLLRLSAVFDIDFNVNRDTTLNIWPFYINRHFQPRPARNKEIVEIDDIIKNSIKSITNSKKEELLDDDMVYHHYERYYRSAKLRLIFHHFMAIRKNPQVIILIIMKGMNFIKLLWARLKGKKSRW